MIATEKRTYQGTTKKKKKKKEEWDATKPSTTTQSHKRKTTKKSSRGTERREGAQRAQQSDAVKTVKKVTTGAVTAPLRSLALHEARNATDAAGWASGKAYTAKETSARNRKNGAITRRNDRQNSTQAENRKKYVQQRKGTLSNIKTEDFTTKKNEYKQPFKDTSEKLTKKQDKVLKQGAKSLGLSDKKTHEIPNNSLLNTFVPSTEQQQKEYVKAKLREAGLTKKGIKNSMAELDSYAAENGIEADTVLTNGKTWGEYRAELEKDAYEQREKLRKESLDDAEQKGIGKVSNADIYAGANKFADEMVDYLVPYGGTVKGALRGAEGILKASKGAKAGKKLTELGENGVKALTAEAKKNFQKELRARLNNGEKLEEIMADISKRSKSSALKTNIQRELIANAIQDATVGTTIDALKGKQQGLEGKEFRDYMAENAALNALFGMPVAAVAGKTGKAGKLAIDKDIKSLINDEFMQANKMDVVEGSELLKLQEKGRTVGLTEPEQARVAELENKVTTQVRGVAQIDSKGRLVANDGGTINVVASPQDIGRLATLKAKEAVGVRLTPSEVGEYANLQNKIGGAYEAVQTNTAKAIELADQYPQHLPLEHMESAVNFAKQTGDENLVKQAKQAHVKVVKKQFHADDVSAKLIATTNERSHGGLLVRVLDEEAEALHPELRAGDQTAGANRLIDENGQTTIYVNPTATSRKKKRGVVAHELGHHVITVEGDKSLITTMKSMVGEKEWNKAYADIEDSYKQLLEDQKAGIVSKDVKIDIDEETACNLFAKKMGNEDIFAYIAGEDEQSFGKMRTYFNDMMKSDPAYKNDADLKEVADRLKEAYEASLKPSFGDVIDQAMAKERSVHFELEGTGGYAPKFYSKMLEIVRTRMKDGEKIGANPTQIHKFFEGRGAKPEEVKFSGIDVWLDGRKSVSKKELSDYLESNSLYLTEEKISQPRWSYYAMGGGHDYREIVYRFPDRTPTTHHEAYGQDYTNDALRTHWSERTDPNGILLHTREQDFSSSVGTARQFDEFDFNIETVTSIGDEIQGSIYPDINQYTYNSIESDYGLPIWIDVTKHKDGTFSADIVSSHTGEIYGEIDIPNKDAIAGYIAQTLHKLGKNKIVEGVYPTSSGRHDILFIDEIQSDYHNAALKKGLSGDKIGYYSDERYYKAEDEFDLYDKKADQHRFQSSAVDSLKTRYKKAIDHEYALLDAGKITEEEYRERYQQHTDLYERLLSEREKAINEINYNEAQHEYLADKLHEANIAPPEAPYRKTYTDYALKNAFREAAENGQDYVAWTTAEQQAKRWSSNYIEGYTIQYDRDMVKFANKYVQTWDKNAKVEKIILAENGEAVWAIKLPENMKEEILYKGQGSFMLVGNKAQGGLKGINKKIKDKISQTTRTVHEENGIPKAKERLVTKLTVAKDKGASPEELLNVVENFRQETGYVLLPDGNMAFEILDGGAHFKQQMTPMFQKYNKKELDRFRFLDHKKDLSRGLTRKEKEEYKVLKRKENSLLLYNDGVELGEILGHQTLFNAYPQLAYKVKVKMVDEPLLYGTDEPLGGDIALLQPDGTILLNQNLFKLKRSKADTERLEDLELLAKMNMLAGDGKKELAELRKKEDLLERLEKAGFKNGSDYAKSSLLHEIQHWIQQYEGWSSGFSVTKGRRKLASEVLSSEGESVYVSTRTLARNPKDQAIVDKLVGKDVANAKIGVVATLGKKGVDSKKFFEAEGILLAIDKDLSDATKTTAEQYVKEVCAFANSLMDELPNGIELDPKIVNYLKKSYELSTKAKIDSSELFEAYRHTIGESVSESTEKRFHMGSYERAKESPIDYDAEYRYELLGGKSAPASQHEKRFIDDVFPDNMLDESGKVDINKYIEKNREGNKKKKISTFALAKNKKGVTAKERPAKLKTPEDVKAKIAEHEEAIAELQGKLKRARSEENIKKYKDLIRAKQSAITRYNNRLSGGEFNGEQVVARGTEDIQGTSGQVQGLSERAEQGEVRGGNEQNATVSVSGLGRDAVTEEQRKALGKYGKNVGRVVDRSETPQEFIDQLQANAKTQKFGVAVDTDLKAEDLKGAKLYTASMGNVTIGVKADGDIFGLAKNTASKDPEAFNDAMFTAIANGGIKMDNYGGFLTNMYAQFGFEPVAKVPFDPQYISAENLPVFEAMQKRGIKPDVYVMKHNGDSLEEIAKKQAENKYKSWTQEELDALPTKEYDDALKYRDELIEKDKAERAKKKKKKSTKKRKPYKNKVTETPQEALANAKKGYISKNEIGQHMERLQEDWLTEIELVHNMFTDLAKRGLIGGKVGRKVPYDEAFAKAQKDVEKDIDAVFARVIGREDYVVETPQSAADKDALLHELARRAANGDKSATKKCIQVEEKCDEAASLSGHGLQLQSYILRNSPNGRLRWAVRQVKRMNMEYGDRLNGKKLELTEEQAELIMKEGTEAEMAKALDKVEKELWKQIPSGKFEAMNQVRHWAMLFNPKTHGRNLGGNSVFWTARQVSNYLETKMVNSAPVQARIKAKSGEAKLSEQLKSKEEALAKATTDEEKAELKKEITRLKNAVKEAKESQKANMTETVTSRDFTKDTKKLLNERFEADYLNDSKGSVGRWSDSKRSAGYLYEQSGNKVKDTLAKGMNKLIDTNYHFLEKEDMLFFRPAYRKEYIRYCKAKGICEVVDGKKVVTKEILDNMSDVEKQKASSWALQQAKIATFRDDSAVSKYIIKMKNATEKNAGTGKPLYRLANVGMESMLPFVKTPVNILRRGLDYSPVGLARGLYSYAAAKDVEGFLDAIHYLSTGLTGSTIWGLGVYAAMHDMVTVNAGDVSGDEYYDREMGFQDYSILPKKILDSMHIKIFDKDYSASIDWLAPMQFPFFQGAAFYENLCNGKGFSVSNLMQALEGSFNPLLEMSFMSSTKDNVQSFFERAYYNSDGDEASWVEATARTFFGSVPQGWLSGFIPQMVSQGANAKDYYVRDTSSTAKDAWVKSWDSFGKKMQNKIPVLREQLMPKVNHKGEDVSNKGKNVMTKMFNAFANPANVKKIEMDKYDQAVIDVYNSEELKEAKDENREYLILNLMGNPAFELANGKRMTYEEKHDYTAEKREKQWSAIKEMVDAKSYGDMTDAMKAEEMKDYHYISTTQADAQVYGYEYATQKLYDKDKDSQYERPVIEKARRYGISDEKYIDSYIATQSLYARTHRDDYYTKALALEAMKKSQIYVGDKKSKTSKEEIESLEKAYGVWGDKIEPAKKLLDEVGNVTKALTEYSNGLCSGVGYCKKNGESVNKRTLSFGMANSKDVPPERVYRAAGYSWNEAQAGGGLKHYGYTFETLKELENDALLEFDTDHSNALKTDEAKAFVDSLNLKDQDEAACVFQYLIDVKNNPYGTIKDWLKWGSEPDESSGGGRGKGGYGHGGRRGGGGGGGGSSSGAAMPKTSSGAIQGKTTDVKTSSPFSSRTGTTKSNLDDAYRKRARKLREQMRK